MSKPTTDYKKPPTGAELGDMEISFNVAKSYLNLLNDILTPPDGIDSPDPGLDRFDKQSRFAIAFMLGDISTALKHYEILIKYSYDTIMQGKEIEVMP